MIPSARTLLDGYNADARRLHYPLGPAIEVVRALREEAIGLARHPHDEPAALFFVFARRPANVGESWSALPSALAYDHADRLGLVLGMSEEDLRDLRLDINLEGLPFEYVAGWFRTRIAPAR